MPKQAHDVPEQPVATGATSLKAATCTHHCGNCGLHFHSLEAFDKHRTGDHGAPNGSVRGRRCIHPLDMDGSPLVAVSEIGECRIGPVLRRPVTIWTSARAVRASTYFNAPQRSRQAEAAA
jgi:hypothetical protein